jgi:hypothetical protein
MLEVTYPVNLLTEVEDKWGWEPERGAEFSVKSTYRTVAKLTEPMIKVTHWQACIFNLIWNCPAPSKVSGFVWQLLHGRIPTRNNLISRRMLAVDGDRSCVMCGEAAETELHLFVYCEVASLVWMEIFHWLDVPFYFPHNLVSIFHCLMELGSKKARKGMVMICCAVLWTLWRCRNFILFDNGTGTVMELVDKIKVSSWKWWISRSKAANSSAVKLYFAAVFVCYFGLGGLRQCVCLPL